jgi:uncharacterized membrane protein YvbJ
MALYRMCIKCGNQKKGDSISKCKKCGTVFCFACSNEGWNIHSCPHCKAKPFDFQFLGKIEHRSG